MIRIHYFLQLLMTCRLNLAKVNKIIGLILIAGDKAKTLGAIEEFDGAKVFFLRSGAWVISICRGKNPQKLYGG